MENKLHNDGLEDFLRKSFEQYDDSPSDGLWDKIDADLADEPKVVPIGAGRHWWIGAVAAILLTLLVGQYFYFQKEMAALVEIINTKAEKIEQLEKESKEQEKNYAEISNTPKKNNDQENVLNKIHQLANPEIKEQKTAINKTQSSISKNSYSKREKENNIINTQPENSVVKNSAVSTSSANSTEAENINLAENKNNNETVVDMQRTTAPNPLGLIGLKNLGQPGTDLSLPATAINPVSHKGNFSIGVHHTYLSTKEKMARVIQRPSGGPNRIFNNTKAMTGSTQMTGISAVYQTKNNWLFESGVNFRKTTLSTSHRALLRFMDRRQNSTSDQQHDFVYALNTSAGVVDIEVRADQTDPTQTIDEFENIVVEIKAEQKIDYVSVPFLVGRQIGHGKWNMTLKSGVLFNFLTQQSFDISGKIISSSLQLRKTDFSKRVGIGLKNTTTDFVAAVGLSYELNKKWGVHISPTLLVPMGNRHNDPYIKSSGFSAGVNFGLNFKF